MHKKYLAFVILSAIVGWTSLIIVLTKLEPCTAPGEITLCKSAHGLGIGLIFASIMVTLAATCTLIGLGFRFWLSRDEIGPDSFNVSLRQGIELAACSVSALILLLLESLTWWSGILLLTITILFELYMSRAPHQPSHSRPF